MDGAGPGGPGSWRAPARRRVPAFRSTGTSRKQRVRHHRQARNRPVQLTRRRATSSISHHHSLPLHDAVDSGPAHLDQGKRGVTSWADGSAGPRRCIVHFALGPAPLPISLAGSGALLGNHTPPRPVRASRSHPVLPPWQLGAITKYCVRVHLYMRVGLLLSTASPRSETSCSGSHELLRRRPRGAATCATESRVGQASGEGRPMRSLPAEPPRKPLHQWKMPRKQMLSWPGETQPTGILTPGNGALQPPPAQEPVCAGTASLLHCRSLLSVTNGVLGRCPASDTIPRKAASRKRLA